MDRRELIRRTTAVIDQLAWRLPPETVQGVRDMADAGEEGEAISEIVAALATRRDSVTEVERTELAALMAAMNLDTDALDQLNVQP
ncbi:MAG: hypothetical protein ACRDT4_11660 [Micromonosporaceae bacterium]